MTENPFKHLDSRTRDLAQLIEAKNALDAQQHNPPVELPRPVRPDRPPQPVNNTALANAILRAGERRRGELIGEPEPGSVAAHIIAAGKRRRGEV
jgi:hypothetical protein